MEQQIFDAALFWVLISSPLLIAALWAGIWEKIEQKRNNTFQNGNKEQK